MTIEIADVLIDHPCEKYIGL